MSRRIGIAAAIWAVAILLSRVIGLVREAVFGRVVGGGMDASLYLTAFRIPDFLNYLLAAGALSIVFIPIFAGHLARGDEDRAWRSFSGISTFLAILLLVGTAGAWVAVPYVDRLLFDGFGPEALVELDAMTRVLIPAQIFHVLGGLLSSALMARDRHVLPALAPLVYTGCIIAGGLVGGLVWPESGAWGFVWGVLVGSVLGPFGLPLVGCLRMGLRYRPRLAWDEDLKRYLWLSLPIMLAFSVVVYDDWLIAANGDDLGESAVATVMYAKSLMKVPMGVFGLALGAAAFPTLSRLVGEGKDAQAYTTLATSIKTMLVLAMGAQVVLTASGTEIAEVIYGSRLEEGQHAAIGSALALMGLGLWAWSAQTVLSRGFYAKGRTWIPSLLGSGVVLVAWPLYPWLASFMDTDGLALASTVAISAYALTLVFALRRVYPGVKDGFGAFALRAIPALAIGLGVALGLRAGLDLKGLTGLYGLVGALLQGGLFGVVAGAVFAGVALLFRVPGADAVVGIVRRRLGR